MNCWNCKAILLNAERKLSFRAICDTCDAALHCCKNCKYFAPGRPNDCAVPGTDYISDRTANNFCDEFSQLETASILSTNQENRKFQEKRNLMIYSNNKKFRSPFYKGT